MNALGKAIKRFRLEAGLSHKDVGKLLGVTATPVRHYEQGFALPSFSVLQRMARLFQWTAAEVGHLVLTVEVNHRNRPGPISREEKVETMARLQERSDASGER
jgi:transcriptional regulator with XRE-family HTH domain